MSKIKLYGVPRSGGTLIYNIIKELLPNENILPQTHSFFNDGEYVVVTYRDFRDCAISSWRVGQKFDNIKNQKKASFSELFFYIEGVKNNIKSNLDSFKKENSKRKILFLRYENWIYDHSFLYDELENFFQLNIELDKRDKISKKFSIEKTKNIQANYSSFKYFDKETHFHGYHVHTGNPGTWIDLTKEKDVKLFTFSLKNELLDWGYIEKEKYRIVLKFRMYLRYLFHLSFYIVIQNNFNLLVKYLKK